MQRVLLPCLFPRLFPRLYFLPRSEHAQNTYRVSSDGSLSVTFASGMEVTLSTEPHISSGVVSPTVGKCNISLPGEHSHSLIEWRQRRDTARANYTAYERRLRVGQSLDAC